MISVQAYKVSYSALSQSRGPICACLKALQCSQSTCHTAGQDEPGLRMQIPLDGDASLLTEDYLYTVFLFPVNKAEALAYYDHGGPLPTRYAKVIAVRGAHSPPDVMEYKVKIVQKKNTTPCLFSVPLKGCLVCRLIAYSAPALAGKGIKLCFKIKLTGSPVSMTCTCCCHVLGTTSGPQCC